MFINDMDNAELCRRETLCVRRLRSEGQQGVVVCFEVLDENNLDKINKCSQFSLESATEYLSN